MTQTEAEISRKKVNLETSKMAWHELQRFFANGSAVFVASDLDLVDVAYQFSQDNKIQVGEWMSANKVAIVSDSQAKDWIKNDEMLWAVVIKPWILVQEMRHENE